MKTRDPLRACPLCKEESGPQYLGDPDQIEELLELDSTKTREHGRKIDGCLQAREESDPVLKQTK